MSQFFLVLWFFVGLLGLQINCAVNRSYGKDSLSESSWAVWFAVLGPILLVLVCIISISEYIENNKRFRNE